MISQEGGFYDHIFYDLPLHRHTPLVHPRRTAAIPVDQRRRALHRRARHHEQARIVARPIQRFLVDHQRLRKNAGAHAVARCGNRDRIEAETRCGWLRRRRSQRAISQSPARADDCPGVELIRRAQPRRNRIGIHSGELTTAPARPRARVNHRAQQPVGIGIRRRGTEAGFPVVNLDQRLLQIPAQPVVECQLMRRFPCVLQIGRPRRAPVLRGHRIADRHAVILAQQETRPGRSRARAARQRLPVKRLRRFRAAERVSRSQTVVAVRSLRVHLPVHARLVRMVPVHPAHRRRRRRLLIDCQQPVARPERHRDAAQHAVANTGDARISRARRPYNAELRRIVTRTHRRYRVRIHVADKTGAEVKKQRRRNRLVVVHARRFAADVLQANPRERVRQAIDAVRLVRVLNCEISGDLDLVAEVLIHLDRGNLLQLKKRTRLREIVDEIVAQIRLRQRGDDLHGHRIEPALRDDVARERRQHAASAGIDYRRIRIVNRVLNNRTPREIVPQISVRRYGQIVAQIAGDVRAVRYRRRSGIEILPVAILFQIKEEKRLVLAVIDFRNPDRATD